MRSSVNYAPWNDAAMVTSPRLPRQTRNGQDDPPAQGSIRVTALTSKMKEVRVEFARSFLFISLVTWKRLPRTLSIVNADLH